MWVVVHPKISAGWWPQTARVAPFGEKWSTTAWVGEEENVGEEFEILVVLVDKGINQDYQNCLEKGKAEGKYPEIPLPEDVTICDSITVTRK